MNEQFDFFCKTSLKSYNLDEKIRYQLSMLDSLDAFTRRHSENVATITCRLCEYLKLDEGFTVYCTTCAYLHDIGKIFIPPSVLQKPGKLTDEEFAIMKTHTTLGSKIIDRAIEIVPDSAYLEEAKNLSEYHHEKWNGKGYPNGIAGEEIPLSARIMAVADVFDALVSRRSYKAPFSFEKAMDIIKNDAGTHFDPLVVEAFAGASDKVRKVCEEFSTEKAEE